MFIHIHIHLNEFIPASALDARATSHPRIPSVYLYLHVHLHTHTHICTIPTCTFTHTHTYYTYMYIYTHTHTHTYVYLNEFMSASALDARATSYLRHAQVSNEPYSYGKRALCIW